MHRAVARIAQFLALGALLSMASASTASAQTEEEAAVELLQLSFLCPPPVTTSQIADRKWSRRAVRMAYEGSGTVLSVVTFSTEIWLGEQLVSKEAYLHQSAWMKDLSGVENDGSKLTITCTGDCIWVKTTDDIKKVKSLGDGLEVNLDFDPVRKSRATFQMCDEDTAEVAAEIINVFIVANDK